jgi:ATP synthase protein I
VLHERELSERLTHLDDELAEIRRDQDQRRAERERELSSIDASAMARGFRLSSEFVGSVLFGGAVGWGLDHLLPTSPWGLIVFILVGFVAGLFNLVRTASIDPDKRSDHL